MKVSLSFFWLDFWQQLTGQVCKCKHTKRHHLKLGEPFNDRSDVQCHDWVFTGKPYGDGGLLGCCQCLSYHQRELMDFHWYRWIVFNIRKPKPLESDPDKIFCYCGHSALAHGIGDNSRPFEPLYPPCTKCKCPEYDYAENPSIGGKKNMRFSV